MKCVDIENDYFEISFANPADFSRVLADGPWIVFGHNLTVQPWSLAFDPSHPYPTSTVSWIRIPNLPSSLYHKPLLEQVGSMVGKVIKIDERTLLATRGRFARMAVTVDLTQPLISRILVNGKLKVIEYEALPIACFHCGVYVESRKRPHDPRGPIGSGGGVRGAASTGSRFDPLSKDSAQNPREGANSVGDNNGKKNTAAKNKGKAVLVDIVNPFSGIDLTAIPSTNGPFVGRSSAVEPPEFANAKRTNRAGKNLGFASGSKTYITRGPLGQPSAHESTAKSTSGLGCGHPRFDKHIKEYYSEFHPDIVTLVETRISSHTANLVISKLNFSRSHKVEARGFAGGIWIVWNDNIELEVLQNHPQFIHCRVKKRPAAHWVFVSFVYGSPQKSIRKLLWAELLTIACTMSTPWLLAGDFNAILCRAEKKGSISLTYGGDPDFQNFIFSAGLHDMGFMGPQFTWSRGNLFERLDRALCNAAWDLSYSRTIVSHLHRLKPAPRPFRFFPGWLSHEGFGEFVRNSWLPNLRAPQAVERLREKAIIWNKSTFGEILDHEEFLWKLRSRDEWLSLGDRNTKYYHHKTLVRRKVNRIEGLKIDGTNWCFDDDALQRAASLFFSNLYTVENVAIAQTYIRGHFPRLSAMAVNVLKAPIQDTEIREALFSMAPQKAPGIDGFHAQFFQDQWDVVGSSICSMVRRIFLGDDIHPLLTRTLLC
ncbi:hypothetical protein K2173_023066 [Erythroxylum novogranatense]|uniref:DUF4283 domain-containing protein n=1 Tax=Erythroxylum novogranatense TaxID=1862640 RepID=A0AAV8T837_9ROSI|nr:hypothetical protein K2173_023066 [Erythroxylum novogranatense]